MLVYHVLPIKYTSLGIKQGRFRFGVAVHISDAQPRLICVSASVSKLQEHEIENTNRTLEQNIPIKYSNYYLVSLFMNSKLIEDIKAKSLREESSNLRVSGAVEASYLSTKPVENYAFPIHQKFITNTDVINIIQSRTLAVEAKGFLLPGFVEKNVNLSASLNKKIKIRNEKGDVMLHVKEHMDFEFFNLIGSDVDTIFITSHIQDVFSHKLVFMNLMQISKYNNRTVFYKTNLTDEVTIQSYLVEFGNIMVLQQRLSEYKWKPINESLYGELISQIVNTISEVQKNSAIGHVSSKIVKISAQTKTTGKKIHKFSTQYFVIKNYPDPNKRVLFIYFIVPDRITYNKLIEKLYIINFKYYQLLSHIMSFEQEIENMLIEVFTAIKELQIKVSFIKIKDFYYILLE